LTLQLLAVILVPYGHLNIWKQEESMKTLDRYLSDLIESKKFCAAVAKREFDHQMCRFEHLSKDEQGELLALAIKEDPYTRLDLMTCLQRLLTNALEKKEATWNIQ
jgi:adenosyl cobinamide kinase/adenosyl cobinamide phosphate guanylyltransferase